MLGLVRAISSSYGYLYLLVVGSLDFYCLVETEDFPLDAQAKLFAEGSGQQPRFILACPSRARIIGFACTGFAYIGF